MDVNTWADWVLEELGKAHDAGASHEDLCELHAYHLDMLTGADLPDAKDKE